MKNHTVTMRALLGGLALACVLVACSPDPDAQALRQATSRLEGLRSEILAMPTGQRAAAIAMELKALVQGLNRVDPAVLSRDLEEERTRDLGLARGLLILALDRALSPGFGN